MHITFWYFVDSMFVFQSGILPYYIIISQNCKTFTVFQIFSISIKTCFWTPHFHLLDYRVYHLDYAFCLDFIRKVYSDNHAKSEVQPLAINN